jgi:hypothetical protein
MRRASDVIKRFRSYLQQEAKRELDSVEKKGGSKSSRQYLQNFEQCFIPERFLEISACASRKSTLLQEWIGTPGNNNNRNIVIRRISKVRKDIQS